MANSVPIREILRKSLKGILWIFPCMANKIKRLTAVINMRHHTSHPSFNEMLFPSTPVNPHKKTAVCNLINAPFLMPKKQLVQQS